MYQQSRKIGGDARATRVVAFESLDEFTTVKTDNPKCVKLWRENVGGCFMAGASYCEQWFGAPTREEFDRILDQGDIKYAKMVEEKAVEVAQPRSLKRRRMRGEYGDELDIHKVYAGALSTAWERRGPKLRVATRNIKLLVNIAQNANTSAQKMQWVGVAALRLAEAFEKAGYRVAIDGVDGSNKVSDKEHILCVFPLKSYESPLDIMSLTSAVCFAGFFRGAGFMNLGLADGQISDGLGQAMGDATVLGYLKEFLGETGEEIEIISNQTHSKEAAEAEIARILAKHGYGDNEAEAA